jgi:methylthioribose-1-phosphate isomerase
MKFKTIEWKGSYIRLLDQRRLPGEVRYMECRDATSVARAIRNMTIRGAPAIGVAAAMGIALAAKKCPSHRPDCFRRKVELVCEMMSRTRPTAINLFWAVDRMKSMLDKGEESEIRELKKRLEQEALRIYEEDREINRKIGQHGKSLIREGDGVLTHCNAGALATAGYGTVRVIQAAWTDGKRFQVFADERGRCFRARLTASGTDPEKIPVIVVTDNMADG